MHACVDSHARYMTRIFHQEYRILNDLPVLYCCVLLKTINRSEYRGDRPDCEASRSFSRQPFSPPYYLTHIICSAHAHNGSQHKNAKCTKNATNVKQLRLELLKEIVVIVIRPFFTRLWAKRSTEHMATD